MSSLAALSADVPTDDTAPAAVAKTSRRIPELDGLRGFAALIVVLSHYFGEAAHGLAHLQIGWLGVNTFFVLSGFLIGGIILDQGGKPGFLKSFYFRRVARIFPIYFAVFLSVILLANLTAGHRWSDQPFSAAVYATFTTNFAQSLYGLGSVWLRPTWTLAVEEQFYLLLPFVILFTPRRMLAPLLAGLWVAALAFRIALMDAHPIAAWQLLPCRMDLLLGGVMLAMIYRKLDLSSHLVWLRLTWGILIVALDLLVLADQRNVLLIVMGSATSIGIACFMLAAFYGAPEGRYVRAGWMRWFGQISYCLYLVHQPVNGLLHGLLLNEPASVGSLPSVAVTLLAFGVSVAVAAASWRWFEKPILAWAAAENRSFMQRARSLPTVSAKYASPS
ncbi:MAG TPA: acyltransferase [Rhizomicrobium sp.]|jgi:peptidoglycan/LPS O-acetylase OafA/YrhL